MIKHGKSNYIAIITIYSFRRFSKVILKILSKHKLEYLFLLCLLLLLSPMTGSPGSIVQEKDAELLEYQEVDVGMLFLMSSNLIICKGPCGGIHA